MTASVTILELNPPMENGGVVGCSGLTKITAILGAMIIGQLNRTRCMYDKYIYKEQLEYVTEDFFEG